MFYLDLYRHKNCGGELTLTFDGGIMCLKCHYFWDVMPSGVPEYLIDEDASYNQPPY